ncbi:MAG TPA: hypothetical protein VK137_08735, partial [Planctomycetaceae bacterium]|nr:hypothetical protein [Planctomycetaceae bacterium]
MFVPLHATVAPGHGRRRAGEAARRLFERLALGGMFGATLLGCTYRGEQELSYLGHKDLNYYKAAATTIDYPVADTTVKSEASFARRPRTVLDRDKEEVWDISLTQAIQMAIQNNSMIRTRADNRAASAILSAGDRAPSAYDPSIQETGVLFGGRGVTAALSAFDA